MVSLSEQTNVFLNSRSSLCQWKEVLSTFPPHLCSSFYCLLSILFNHTAYPSHFGDRPMLVGLLDGSGGEGDASQTYRVHYRVHCTGRKDLVGSYGNFTETTFWLEWSFHQGRCVFILVSICVCQGQILMKLKTRFGYTHISLMEMALAEVSALQVSL